jgi:hypothetical protein
VSQQDIPPRFATMHPNQLRQIADRSDAGEVARRGAEDALALLDSLMMPTWRVGTRAPWPVVGQACDIMGSSNSLGGTP